MPYKVCIRIQFLTPCLGNVRCPDPEPNRMMRGSDGNVIFAPKWWQIIMAQSAVDYGRHQEQVQRIRWTPEIDGTLKMVKRYYYANEVNETGQRVRLKRVKLHEGFEANDIIGVKAVVPDGIPLNEFTDILSYAGEYFGISPFGWREDKGRFKVVEAKLAEGVSKPHDQSS